MKREVSSEIDLVDVSSEDEVILTDDIELSGIFSSIKEFDGVFDGNGYTISNLEKTFIREVKENATIKNISFNCASIGIEPAIFDTNKGELKSISITEFNREHNFENNLGVLCMNNKGEIINCSVIDSVQYGHNEVGTIAVNTEGIIKDCEIRNVEINCFRNVGGICYFAEEAKIKNCILEDVRINCCRSEAGGICSKSTGESLLKNNHVKNSYIEADTGLAGIVVRGNSVIKNCSVVSTELCSWDNVSLISGIYSKGSRIVKCSVTDCQVNLYGEASWFTEFCKNGIVKDSFIENTTIIGYEIHLFKRPCSIENSYIELETYPINNMNTTIKYDETDNLYIDIQENQFDTPKTVEVYNSNDLDKVNPRDTVELKDNINFNSSLSDFTYFIGEFNGNGYTIKNLRGSLFNNLGGKVSDLAFRQYLDGNTKRSSVLATYSVDSEISNVDIQSVTVNNKPRFSPIADKIENTTLCQCNVDIEWNSGKKFGAFTGIASRAVNSEIRDCYVDIDFFGVKCGGIVEALSANSIIKNCHTSGTVKVYSGRVGGISLRNPTSTISDCSSDISIISSTSESDIWTFNGIGGISLRNTGKILNCEYNGDIECDVGENGEIGGIVGWSSRIIKNCESQAKISVENNEANISVGGIAGVLQGSIQNCKSSSSIRGGKSVGGLAGRIKSESSGGFFNKNLEAECLIEKSSNHGYVSKGKYTGGLTGKLELDSEVQIKNCYNDSNVGDSGTKGVLFGTVNDKSLLTVSDLFWTPQEYNSDYGEYTEESVEYLEVLLNV